MGRKIFQEFAYEMCQKFVETPSNCDLVNLAILGDGRLELCIFDGRASHNNHTIEQLPFSQSWLTWAKTRMGILKVPESLLVGAALTVDYEVELSRKESLGWLCANFSFVCNSTVEAPDRKYCAKLKAEKLWMLACV